MIPLPALLAALIIGQVSSPGDGAADLTRPRLITLDYRDTPMGTVIRDLSAQSGCRITIFEKMTDWLDTRITVPKAAPLPFWAALDEVCRASRFGMNLGIDGSGACVALFRGSRSGPFADHGVFRIVLREVHLGGRGWQFHLRDDGRPPGGGLLRHEVDRDKGLVDLAVWAEPRMLARGGGKLHDLVAFDEAGRSLLPADPDAAQEPDESGFTPLPKTLFRVPLAPIDRPVRAIKFLSGKALVVVARLDPQATSLPLADAVGKTIRGPRTVVTIRSITRRPIEDELVVILPGAESRPETGMVVAATLGRSEPPRPGEVRPPLEFEPSQFECVDAAGKTWTATSNRLTGESPRLEGDAIAFDLRFSDEDLQPMPWSGKLDDLTLHYRELTAVPVAVPFEFRDIALP